MDQSAALIQGTDEWRQARCGRVTASCFADVLAKGQGKTRSAYMRRIVAEILTGKPIDTYKNSHMERGQEQECFARMAYEEETGYVVHEVGFIPHPTLMAGCSPDGLVRPKGGVEIKSVIPTVQLETILKGGYPSEHTAQIQGNMWLTGAEWWHFVSYCPDMPPNIRTYIFKVNRDDTYIKTLESEVTSFLSEVSDLVEKLNGINASEIR